jgi:hypothetical protein
MSLAAGLLAGRAAFFSPLASLALGLSALGLLSAGSSGASAAGCPNQLVRTGYSANLPDCRAYEFVSGPKTQPYFNTFGRVANVNWGVALFGELLGTTASASSLSSGIAYLSTVAPPESPSDGPIFFSSRGPKGWTTENLIPPQGTAVTLTCTPYMIAWSPNMERGVLSDGFNSAFSSCGGDEPELVPGEPREHTQNLFVRDISAHTYQLVDQKGLAVGEPANAIYQGGSSDLGVIAFSEEARAHLDPTKYYVWAGGTVDRLLTVLPDGTATEGEIANAAIGSKTATNPTSPSFIHAVAPDGSRIEFTAGGKLYSRLNPGAPQSHINGAEECDEPAKACTVQLDISETVASGGGGTFVGASGQDGSVVYFTDANALTADSTAAAGEPDLYEYDFNRPEGARLKDITVDHNAGEHANVLGYVASNEAGPAGEYVYFVADGAIASNQNSLGALATPGAPNLYVAHGGALSFIATLSAATDNCDWENRCMTGRLSSTGRYLGFNSLEELTGFDNLDGATGQPDQEIFLYDAEAAQLRCASCGTTGVPPIAPASIGTPEGVPVVDTPLVLTLQRNVSDNGQVFFDTSNPLLPAARNGNDLYTQANVYEYQGGQLHLLSSGTAESSSFFYDASQDGNDVYLISFQSLTPEASPSEISIFDAKVDGGFPAPLKAAEPCAGEACSGPQTPATHPPANATESFTGPGNVVTTTTGNVKASVKLATASLAKGRQTLVLKITVSGGGRIVVALKGGHTLARSVTKAGTYVLRLSTTVHERTALKHRQKLTVSVTYRAADGATARATRSINAKR